MRSLDLKLGFVVVFFAALAAIQSGEVEASTWEAYVTLLYGDEFLLGVRVLGKSIRNTRSTRDTVVLVSDGVSDYAKELLEADGWIVKPISLLANPNQIRPKRFWGVYTKLKVFNMTEYKKVLYLDADTIVLKNIDDLFKCGKFCANLKHSERLNSGVMVVQPSETVFKDMMEKVNTLHSYTGGDQGFLNSYFVGFASAPVFDPNLPPEAINSRKVPEMERLSTLYNADVGLYMLANKWMVNETELRVIHYTLGPLKPWDWWTAWLLKPVDAWQNIRGQLEETLPGTGGGRDPREQFFIKFLTVFPVLALFACYYRTVLQNRDVCCTLRRSSVCDNVRHLYFKYKSGGTLATYSAVGVASTSIMNSNQQYVSGMHPKVPAYLGGFSILVCFMTAAASLALAFSVIPRQVKPWTGLLVMYEWIFASFFLVFRSYLHLVYDWGKTRANQVMAVSSSESFVYDSGKGHQRQVSSCDAVNWLYGLGIAFLGVVAPSLPYIFGITALFARLASMVAGGLILASFMTYASEHLAIRAFVKGQEDRDLTRNTCFLC